MEVAGYQDLRQIGRGAFATVFRARQITLDREVALKVMDLDVDDPDARHRFDRECKAVARLGWHPHVLPVYDAGDAGRRPYLSMELVTGGSLAERLRADGTFAEEEALELAVQIADALEAAHQEGVIHRDVKPGNVLVDRFGNAKLSDFGVALVGNATGSTIETLSGTLGFLAPELLDGEVATPSSDVYALGATLHLMLTGTSAFRARTGESPLGLLHRISREAPPDLTAHGMSDRLATLVAKMLAKTPAERFARAADFIDAAERVMVANGRPLIATYTPRPSSAASLASKPGSNTATPPPSPGPETPRSGSGGVGKGATSQRDHHPPPGSRTTGDGARSPLAPGDDSLPPMSTTPPPQRRTPSGRVLPSLPSAPAPSPAVHPHPPPSPKPPPPPVPIATVLRPARSASSRTLPPTIGSTRPASPPPSVPPAGPGRRTSPSTPHATRAPTPSPPNDGSEPEPEPAPGHP